MRIAYPVFGIILLSLLSGASNAFVNPADQCTSIGVTDDSCIMCSGTPCMMNIDPDICPGTVNSDEPAWGPIAWIGGSSPCICYCPYSLYQAYQAAHQNLCANVYCYDKCENSQEYRSGSCNSGTGLCDYATKNQCQYGCNTESATTFCADAPETVDKCANVYCYNKCENSQEYKSGTCNSNTGKCEYSTTNYCDHGCDGSSCAAATAPTDKCADVQCPDKCDGNTLKTGGECDSDTGNCVYSETDCGDVGCNASSLACNEQASATFAGRIYYTEYNGPNGVINENGKQVPLRNMKVLFQYTGADSKTPHRDEKKYATVTDSEGKFSWNAPAEFMVPGNKIDAVASFQDSGGKLFITTDKLDTSGKRVPLEYYIVTGVSPSDPSLLNMETDLKSEAYYAPAAQIYANTMKAVEFKENVLGSTQTKEERVTIYHSDKDGTYHVSEYSSTNKVTGMAIASEDTKYYLPEAPNNREYHEYCHHIQMEALKEDRFTMPLLGTDHKGYQTNRNSGWGYLEGWAEFCSLQMVRHISGIQDVKYVSGNVIYNLEFDYPIRGQDYEEEFSIAGIMHDLADSPSDYSYGTDDDSVSLPLSDIWSAVSTPRDFGSGTMHVPYNLREFYVAISDVADSAATQPGIDAIFISHGAYQDENGNGKWDPGEPIGYSGEGNSSSDIRPDFRPPEGTQVEVSGGDGLLARVSVNIDGPQSYLSYSYTEPISNNKVYLPPIPEKYNGTVSLTAVDGRSGTASTKTFLISASNFRQGMDPSRPIGAYEPGISATSGSCNSDSQCLAWNAGDTCKSGSCEYATSSGGNQPGSSSGALCFGPAAIAFVISLLAWRRKS